MIKLFKNENKTYELPLARNYVAHWGLVEAVREILQNAIDSDSPFRCTYVDNVLRIVSENSELPIRTLLLGNTTKSDDTSKIGSFGEGYKIALLVLAREEIPVKIYNGGVIWNPYFGLSDTFGEEVLMIKEEWRDKNYQDRLVFELSNISETDYEAVKKSCLYLWTSEEVGQVMPTAYGNIMTKNSGKLYVNGLYVCDTELDYSYDIKPEYIQLERDRKTVSDWELKYMSKNMWFDTGRYDEVAEMIENGIPDMYNADINTPSLVKEACYNLFKRKHPGAVAAKSQEELDRLVANGMTNVVFVNPTYHTVLGYETTYANQAKVAIMTPTETLSGWLRENRKHMRKEAIVNFKQLAEKAEGWKVK